MSTKKKLPKKRRASKVSAADADKLLTDYQGRKAVIPRKLMFEIEAATGKDNYRTTRMVALSIISMPCKRLMREIKKDRATAVAFATAQIDFPRYISALRGLIGFVEEADRRVGIALCLRTDMGEVLEEAGDVSKGIDCLPEPDGVRDAFSQKAIDQLQ